MKQFRQAMPLPTMQEPTVSKPLTVATRLIAADIKCDAGSNCGGPNGVSAYMPEGGTYDAPAEDTQEGAK